MLETRMSNHTTGSANHPGHQYHRSNSGTPTGSPPYSTERMTDYHNQQMQNMSGNGMAFTTSGEHTPPGMVSAQNPQMQNSQGHGNMQNIPPHMQQAMNQQGQSMHNHAPHPTSHPASATQPTSFSRPLPPSARPKATIKRQQSKSGGVQMVLDESGSWSELADQSLTLPAEGYGDLAGKGGKAGANSGMLGFLSRKKGRDRSPKPTEPGVLGKEGARQIMN